MEKAEYERHDSIKRILFNLQSEFHKLAEDELMQQIDGASEEFSEMARNIEKLLSKLEEEKK